MDFSSLDIREFLLLQGVCFDYLLNLSGEELCKYCCNLADQCSPGVTPSAGGEPLFPPCADWSNEDFDTSIDVEAVMSDIVDGGVELDETLRLRWNAICYFGSPDNASFSNDAIKEQVKLLQSKGQFSEELKSTLLRMGINSENFFAVTPRDPRSGPKMIFKKI